MNKKYFKVKAIIITLIVILFIGIVVIKQNTNKDDNFQSTIQAVVVKVDNTFMYVQGLYDGNELYHIKISDNVEYKKGQEIIIYFDGTVMETYPAQLGNINKIEIINENSNSKISESSLRYCYNSDDNVSVVIGKFTSSEISFYIQDTNEYKYSFANTYKVYRKVLNTEYTGVGEKVGQDTNNSISGYTRNRLSIYLARSR